MTKIQFNNFRKHMITEYLYSSNKVTSEDTQKFETDHTFELLHFIFISSVSVPHRIHR